MEEVGLTWQRVKPYLLGFLAILVVSGAIWALIYVPSMMVPKEAYWLDMKTIFDIKNESRRTIAYIIGGILAIIGIILTFRRIRALERQVLVAQEGQISERFTRAIEQLCSDRMEIRLGGLYALERIANDSDKDYWPIMETLTAYVRENSPWREQAQDNKVKALKENSAIQETLTSEKGWAQSPGEGTTTPAPTAPKSTTDIQIILNVLGRRKYRYGQEEEKERLDLRNSDLRGAFLISAHLEGASLWLAHLERAHFAYAHLEKAELVQAHLEGALLGGAIGLTWAQLDKAFIDEKTVLPSYLHEERQRAMEQKATSEE